MEENLITPIQIIRYDNCPFCKRNAIEVFNTNSYPMHYSQAVLEYMSTGKSSQFDRSAIYKMKCRGCGKEFDINWIDGFPRPCINGNRDRNIFLKCFRDLDGNKSESVIKDYFKDIL